MNITCNNNNNGDFSAYVTDKSQNRNKKASVTADDYSSPHLTTRKQHLQHPIIEAKMPLGRVKEAEEVRKAAKTARRK